MSAARLGAGGGNPKTNKSLTKPYVETGSLYTGLLYLLSQCVRLLLRLSCHPLRWSQGWLKCVLLSLILPVSELRSLFVALGLVYIQL
jgi:hypothetical protein